MPTQPTYEDLGPDIDPNSNETKPGKTTQGQEEANKNGDDFYEAEEHTYSAVMKKRAKTSGGAG